MLDLKNPDHVAALRHACEIKAQMDASKIATYAVMGSHSGKSLVVDAFEVISSPASAADLIRQLVERAGVKLRVHWPYYIDVYPSVDGMVLYSAVDASDDRDKGDSILMSDIPATIARLLALAPKAGAVEVLKALRGVR